MRTNIKTANKLTMVSEMTKDSKFQILEYERLDGGNTTDTRIKTQTLNEKNIKLNQVRIILEDSILYIQNHKISYFMGDISVKNEKNRKPMSLGKKIFTGKLLEEPENTVKPLYDGSGEVFLKPSFDNYVLIELEDEEAMVLDENFVAAEATLHIESVVENNKNLLRLSGGGIIVLEIPVPELEIFKCNLSGSTLKTDGNLVVLRKGDISFSTEASNDYVNEEERGVLDVYSGSGEVWLMPTINAYDVI